MIKRHQTNWFKENGFFSEEGLKSIMHFSSGLQDLVNKEELSDLNINQLFTLKSNLQKMVGDALLEVITKKRLAMSALGQMTDEELFDHLNAKHGEGYWMEAKGMLSTEEADRVDCISQDKIKLLERDFLDEIIDERTAKNPNFPGLMKTKKK
jgi:hypothetical protein